jgi:hypothetical protein
MDSAFPAVDTDSHMLQSATIEGYHFMLSLRTEPNDRTMTGSHLDIVHWIVSAMSTACLGINVSDGKDGMPWDGCAAMPEIFSLGGGKYKFRHDCVLGCDGTTGGVHGSAFPAQASDRGRAARDSAQEHEFPFENDEVCH